MLGPANLADYSGQVLIDSRSELTTLDRLHQLEGNLYRKCLDGQLTNHEPYYAHA